jgi:ribonuclease-3
VAIGYVFRDVVLAECAITLPSWYVETAVGRDNQRLEFLGDAVLGLLAANHLYNSFPDLDEGEMSLLRTRVTSGRALAEVAREIGLNALLRIGKSEEAVGGREREGALADAIEAVFGAVWLDGGLAAVEGVYNRLLAHRASAANGVLAVRRDNPKGCLQELTQAEDGSVPCYRLVTISGPPHKPLYRVSVTLNSGLRAMAEGASKRAAEAAAAQAVLELLEQGDGGK